MATYAIGDLQGCYDPLIRLLDRVGFSDSDTLWFAGDLVNRGPQSLECLRFVKSLGKRAKVSLGNHDLHLLAIHHGAVPVKRHDTLDEILLASDRDELMHWLQQQKLFVQSKKLGYAMTHAGIPPHWTIKQTKQRAKEVEQVLRSPLAIEFFRNMYGNQPDCWNDQLVGWPRLRTITNYLTRMRFCDPTGRLEFDSKEGLDSQPMGYLPWYIYRKPEALKILFGHWAALGGSVPNADIEALDTGCVWGNSLTAFQLETQKRTSCQCPSQPHLTVKESKIFQ